MEVFRARRFCARYADLLGVPKPWSSSVKEDIPLGEVFDNLRCSRVPATHGARNAPSARGARSPWTCSILSLNVAPSHPSSCRRAVEEKKLEATWSRLSKLKGLDSETIQQSVRGVISRLHDCLIGYNFLGKYTWDRF